MLGFGGDPRLIINLTVWESLEAMRAFLYEDPHRVAVMRLRREWFQRLGPYTVLWWVPVGHHMRGLHSSVPEAEARLQHLDLHGPTPAAFTSRRHFDSPEAGVEHVDDG